MKRPFRARDDAVSPSFDAHGAGRHYRCMATESPTDANTARPALETGLYWGVRASFVNYIASGDGIIHAEGGVETDGHSLFRFPLVDVSDDGGLWRLRFAGTLRFFAHFGALDVGFDAPRVELGDAGRMIVGVRGSDVEIARVQPAAPVLVEDRLIWPPLRTTLTPEGAAVFGDAYAPGEELDALRVVATSSRRGKEGER